MFRLACMRKWLLLMSQVINDIIYASQLSKMLNVCLYLLLSHCLSNTEHYLIKSIMFAFICSYYLLLICSSFGACYKYSDKNIAGALKKRINIIICNSTWLTAFWGMHLVICNSWCLIHRYFNWHRQLAFILKYIVLNYAFNPDTPCFPSILVGIWCGICAEPFGGSMIEENTRMCKKLSDDLFACHFFTWNVKVSPSPHSRTMALPLLALVGFFVFC